LGRAFMPPSNRDIRFKRGEKGLHRHPGVNCLLGEGEYSVNGGGVHLEGARWARNKAVEVLGSRQVAVDAKIV